MDPGIANAESSRIRVSTSIRIYNAKVNLLQYGSDGWTRLGLVVASELVLVQSRRLANDPVCHPIPILPHHRIVAESQIGTKPLGRDRVRCSFMMTDVLYACVQQMKVSSTLKNANPTWGTPTKNHIGGAAVCNRKSNSPRNSQSAALATSRAASSP